MVVCQYIISSRNKKFDGDGGILNAATTLSQNWHQVMKKVINKTRAAVKWTIGHGGHSRKDFDKVNTK